MYISGYSACKTGKVLGISHGSVYNILKDLGIETRPIRKYEIDEFFFDEIDSEIKAYFLGFLFADGCNRGAPTYIIELMLAEQDKEILENLSSLIYKDRPLVYKRTKGKRQNVYRLLICSKHISESLSALGCVSRKTHSLTYPCYLDNSLHDHFIRGYFDGDGSLFMGSQPRWPQWRFTICSTFSFCTGVANIFSKSMGIDLNVRPHSNKSSYVIDTSGNVIVPTIMDWLYKDATIYLQRKHSKYIDMKDMLRK